MKTALIAILAVLLLGAVYVVLPVVAGAYRRYRGVKHPVCPETGEPALVTLDARHAAVSAAAGRPELRVATCSRWPEHDGCDQGCTEELEGGRSVPAQPR